MKINKPYKRKKIILMAVIAVFVLCIVGWFAWNQIKNSTNQTKNGTSGKTTGYYNPSTSTPNPNVPKSTSQQGQSNDSIGSEAPGSSSNVPPTLDANITPSKPLGSFVSNHKPNLSGNPSPNLEVSACTTTAGAKCQITFTSNGTVKSLPKQTTDANGNTSWSWKLQDIGLTTGTWTITAIASNGDLTASSTDVTPLQVN